MLLRLALVPVAAAVLAVAGCTSSLTTGTQSSVNGGSVFVVGTDAPPLAAVVGFPVTITSITANPATGTPVCLISNCTTGVTADFARFNGLQTVLDDSNVPQGTYNSITITLGTGTIDYLNVPTCTPTPCTPAAPTIATTAASYSPSNSVTITLANPLVVQPMGGEPVGLRIDFDLAKSIQVSGTPATITGAVNPTFDVSTVTRTDTFAHIDEFIGSVTTLPTTSGTPPAAAEPNSFVITGPHGEAFTINTTSSTEWDGGASLASLNSTSIVAVAGQFDPAEQTLDADEVALISDTGFYAGGLVTYVTPSSGQATNMQFYVRRVLPSGISEVPLGGLASVNITGNENYGIYWMHNSFTNLLFNDQALTPGQEISVGGADPTASPFDVKRIHLQNWGYNGTVVAGSEKSGQGTFQMNVTGFAGQVISSPITVYLGGGCDFRFGFGKFDDVTDNASIRVVGLLLKLNGQEVLVARHVDGFQTTDMTTTAWQ
jgi:hypothetical protein